MLLLLLLLLLFFYCFFVVDVLITGASHRIGRHVALNYAKYGANILITARDEKALKVCIVVVVVVVVLLLLCL